MKTIYIVYGRTGEYADYTEWNVKAFRNKGKAKLFCQKINDWCKENGLSDGWTNSNQINCPYDEYFHVDYTGTKYDITEVEYDDAERTDNKYSLRESAYQLDEYYRKYSWYQSVGIDEINQKMYIYCNKKPTIFFEKNYSWNTYPVEIIVVGKIRPA